MIDSRCGLHCTGCAYKTSCGCGGCIETMGHPFHGECPVAICCQEKGFEHCGECPEIPCALLTAYSCDPEQGDTPHGARIEQCKKWQEEAMREKIVSLRMERQCLGGKADENEYRRLYRDTQPGRNVYWNGFGQPPVLSFRAAFDDTAFNRQRQFDRMLVKGRFEGGNLGWIEAEEMPLFLALYRKPIPYMSFEQRQILDVIERMGPVTIHQIKEETGMLVKQITPILHRLQQAFLIYEDQYDEDWERGWYRFDEMFPNMKGDEYTRQEALRVVLPRFAYRMVWFDIVMAKSFYRLPEKEIRMATDVLIRESIFTAYGGGFMLTADAEALPSYAAKRQHSVFAIHRNDILYRAEEPRLKALAKKWTAGVPYDCEPLQYLLIDGEFHGASVGHFRNGPYDLNDVVCDLADAEEHREEIIAAVRQVNFGKVPLRFMGKPVE